MLQLFLTKSQIELGTHRGLQPFGLGELGAGHLVIVALGRFSASPEQGLRGSRLRLRHLHGGQQSKNEANDGQTLERPAHLRTFGPARRTRPVTTWSSGGRAPPTGL